MLGRRISYIIFIFLFIGTMYIDKGWTLNIESSNIHSADYETIMKRDILSLMMSYPGYIIGVEKNDDENVYIVMESGLRILYDDKKDKTHAEKLSNPDLQDSLEQVYPLNISKKLMPKDFDPGRARVYPLLKEVYGATKEEVQKNLVNVGLAAGSSQFNKNNGASEALKSAMKEIQVLMKKEKGISAFVYPMSGTFNYRVIAGTNQLSPHSFGIAIDLARDKRDYWKWATREQGEKRLESYADSVVKAFENNGFIWGGKWTHFDILHFEYRPEFVIKSKYFRDRPKGNEPWYADIPFDNEMVGEYIEIIERALG